MIPHQQDGVKTEDILLGLCYALVRNYKSNVVQKNNFINIDDLKIKGLLKRGNK
ncbi:hypothetical protein ACWO4B_001750 [Clostridium sporogenes]